MEKIEIPDGARGTFKDPAGHLAKDLLEYSLPAAVTETMDETVEPGRSGFAMEIFMAVWSTP